MIHRIFGYVNTHFMMIRDEKSPRSQENKAPQGNPVFFSVEILLLALFNLAVCGDSKRNKHAQNHADDNRHPIVNAVA